MCAKVVFRLCVSYILIQHTGIVKLYKFLLHDTCFQASTPAFVTCNIKSGSYPCSVQEEESGNEASCMMCGWSKGVAISSISYNGICGWYR